jgi:thymidylate synthase
MYENFDEAYQDLLKRILEEGDRKINRTSTDTISVFGHSFQVDISDRFPLLTLKDMSGGVFNSMIAEVLWYLSGQHHIKDLKEHTSIWNEWADENDNLDFAYGRFWRRYPIPNLKQHLAGEEWATNQEPSMLEKDDSPDPMNWVEFESDIQSNHRPVFDQISYILDTLQNNPQSRRMVLNALHPANAAVANPPACHCMATFNVTDGNTLNCHLNMRSSDVFIGLPFNVAQYSLLTYMLADQVDMNPGSLYYSGTDVHLYVGDDEETEEYDQIEPTKEVLDRNPRKSPIINIEDRPSIDDYEMDDFDLEEYNPHPYIGTKTVP